ncbi:ATP-dependent nuclease [Methylophaga thalassica]|uniref:ATP-dependent nuclease n=1 Tax=Methylophaga aminisulfidivorans TaxID=230105 RepID=UPI003A90D89B
MTILIDKIRISGFRGIKNLEVPFQKTTVLIGANNSGKTSILKALHLALGDYSRYLSEEDFHIDTDEKRVNEIIIDVRIVAVNDSGDRKKQFDEDWQSELGDKIQAEADGSQFVALRTSCKPDPIKGGYDIQRASLEKWPSYDNWQTESIKKSKINARMSSTPFIFIDAQRDIHSELKEKSSFVGKVLSNVNYDEEETAALEALIKEVNDKAIAESQELTNLKQHLDNLNKSFNSSGHAEITPFPKKLRDVSKNFSVNFGVNSHNSFPMEYHGMGTRSWASMLTVKAFVDMLALNHAAEAAPFFPILAAEEPEAHLHPNAQKTLYSQLSSSRGQVFVSTHSPYLAALSDQQELRHVKYISGEVSVKQLTNFTDSEDKRRIKREIIDTRGEILFSNALVLCEGETEEQALPLLFQKYFGIEPFYYGVNFIGVGGSGSRYVPFLRFAKDFSIPVFIFSDGEELTLNKLKTAYESVFGPTDIAASASITVLDGTDFEGYLLSSGFKPCLVNAIKEVSGDDAINSFMQRRQGTLTGRQKQNIPPCSQCNREFYEGTPRDYTAVGGEDRAISEILDGGKTKYAPAVAANLCELDTGNFPPKIIELFENIRSGVSI